MVVTFKHLAAEFLAWCSKARTKKTLEIYRLFFLKFEQDNGDMPLREITPAIVTAWAKTWHERQAIKRLFSWAVNEAFIIERDPIAKLKLPPKGMRRRIMKPSEEKKILRHAAHDLRALLIGLRESYARPQEARGMTWHDVHSDNPGEDLRSAIAAGRVSIVLFDYKARARREESDEPRVILVSPRFSRLLVRLYDRRNAAETDGPIFQTKRGRAWTPNVLRCRFRRMRRRLAMQKDRRGESIVPYTFRHTGATLAAAAGVRDRSLADVLGHVDVRTTSRYVHLQIEHLRAAMAKVWQRIRNDFKRA